MARSGTRPHKIVDLHVRKITTGRTSRFFFFGRVKLKKVQAIFFLVICPGHIQQPIYFRLKMRVLRKSQPQNTIEQHTPRPKAQVTQHLAHRTQPTASYTHHTAH